jgi:Rrf2 family iron-sulfur cluster assembly transcriptional regulator
MLLSQTAEYALRAMAFLATAPPGSAVRARDLSQATGIPAPYASKVLRRMVAAGLLSGQKGHGGGFQLSRPPEEIRFLDVLEAADDSLQPDRCAFGLGRCGGHNPCLLHDSMAALKESVLAWARRTTLAAAVPRPAPSPGAARRRSPR